MGIQTRSKGEAESPAAIRARYLNEAGRLQEQARANINGAERNLTIATSANYFTSALAAIGVVGSLYVLHYVSGIEANVWDQIGTILDLAGMRHVAEAAMDNLGQ